MDLNKTILYESHVSSGAKIAPFGGFLMPIQYQGIIAEHMATRTHAAVFDTCHMGEFHIHHGDALTDLERLLSCRVGTLLQGQCRYGLLCNERGGVIDDLIIYRLGDNDFFLVVNAATQNTDYKWITSHLSRDTCIENVSDTTAKIDLQGPHSPRIMANLMEERIDGLNFYRFMHNRYRGKKVLISRTGYTGEIGFEIYCDHELGVYFWEDCLKKGVQPAGLGARDTLRLEMGFPLYGHELSQERNAAESGFWHAICSDKEFIGSAVILDEAQKSFSLIAMILDGRRAARAEDRIVDETGTDVGMVTSGSFSPSLQKSIAMGYVQRSKSLPGTILFIKTKRNELKATVCQTPLYKSATGRMRLQQFL